MKVCINEFLLFIFNIVNLLLSSVIVFDIWKEVLVKLKLKKFNLDLIEKKNYCFVSNFIFLLKIMEKVVV